jgi:hypothetical protein
MRMFASSALRWVGDQLFRQGSRHALLSIEPDRAYPSMWRVRRPAGGVTDMMSRTRAKDAGLSVALGYLNGEERRAVASPVRSRARRGIPLHVASAIGWASL